MLEKIISGGQTGVDRAALDAALEKGFPCGGWCPAGRKSEDKRIPPRYPLIETRSEKYEPRTEKNVLDSDGTLIITAGKPEGGTLLTVQLARKHERPCFLADVDREASSEIIPRILEWLRVENIEILNVAGPRASKNPDIYSAAKSIVVKVISAFL
jgi:hypothetical protein